MSRGLFITGTGTEVGKTYVAAMIARSLKAAGQRVGVYKPVASGCRRVEGELVADDAVALWEAAGRPGRLEDVCPQRFELPVAPPRAAAAEGRRVDPEQWHAGLEVWTKCSDIVLVEGAGGLMSPLSDELYNIDLARELGYPLVVVAADQLGTINATLQTVITAEARVPELPLAGVVLNRLRSTGDDASLATNADDLKQRCSAPLLATVAPHQTTFEPAVDWFGLSNGLISDSSKSIQA